MKKTQKIILGFLLLGCSNIQAFPSSVDPTNPPKKCETYDLKEEVSYLIDENRQLSLSEEVKYKPSKVLKHIEKCADSEVTVVLNPKEIWQEWMPQLVKTVVDSKGITYLDAEGKVLYHFSKESLAPEQTEELLWEEEVAFELNDRIYASAEKNKAEIVHTDKGYQMKGEDFLLEVDQHELVTMLTFFEKGEYIGSEKVYYSSDDGKPTKKFKISRSVEVDPAGNKVEKVIVSTYSNYKTT